MPPPARIAVLALYLLAQAGAALHALEETSSSACASCPTGVSWTASCDEDCEQPAHHHHERHHDPATCPACSSSDVAIVEPEFTLHAAAVAPVHEEFAAERTRPALHRTQPARGPPSA